MWNWLMCRLYGHLRWQVQESPPNLLLDRLRRQVTHYCPRCSKEWHA